MRIRQHRKNTILEFKSKEEEAKFWDTHDFTDYQDEFKPVRARFARNLSLGITIRLDADTLEALRSQAHKNGIGPTNLARMWILERLGKRSRRSTPKTG